jgi:MYXO-CTERM domain-containing protein
MQLRHSFPLTLGLCTVAALATPRPAHACGGTFCDAGPAVMDPEAMPVDQTGETIVFVMSDTHVEAHIQIQYDPTSGAERFAWLIPILGTAPDFAVGSQRLFTVLQNATVPSYGYVNERESCFFGGGDDWGGDWGGDGGCYGTGGAYGDGGAFTSGADGGGSDGGDDGETTGGGTQVVGQETIGAFDVVVLHSRSAQDLEQWLGDNEFFQDPLATPILQEYIDEGALFAAVRLRNGAGVGEIHPIVMRYEGTEPCVPIRLTRIAAREDMDIRAFFLASARVYPTNYRHVELNPLKLDWVGLASNYKDVVSIAIDTPMVDGHGFVTEFVGPTAVVPREGLLGEAWDHTPFQGATALEAPGLLEAQGLLACDDGACTFFHPLVQGLMAQYLPVPEGVERGEFYDCIECYADQVDLEAWDGSQFARALRERIIGPGQRAQQLLDENPVVTRLYTTISPHEMTVDPMFHVEPGDLSTVDDTAVTSTRYFSCNGRTEMRLAGSSRVVTMPAVDQWPDISPGQMPWVERVTEHVVGMAPVVLIDESAHIDELLAAWNAGLSFHRSASCHEPGADGAFGGCGCRTDGAGAASWGLALLTALALGRRRRRHPTMGSEDASLR